MVADDVNVESDAVVSDLDEVVTVVEDEVVDVM